MSTLPGKLFELDCEHFADWPSAINSDTFRVELATPALAPRHRRSRICSRTDYCPGRIQAHGGQVFVFPYALRTIVDGRERNFLAVVPAPYGRGFSTDACLQLLSLVGERLQASGARLVSDPEELRALHEQQKGEQTGQVQ